MHFPLPLCFSVAKRLVTHERLNDSSSAVRVEEAHRIYQTLFRTLAPVLGHAGVRALFARSLKLAAREHPSGIGSDFNAERLDDAALAQQLTNWLTAIPREDTATMVVDLYARFLGLLTTFIGEPLVLRLVKKAFPAIDETDLKENE